MRFRIGTCCCEAVYPPVACDACSGPASGAFQATIPGLELWTHTAGNPAAELVLLDSISGGVFLCDKFLIDTVASPHGFACHWFGPFLPLCLKSGSASIDIDYVAPVVTIVGASGGTLILMWQDFSAAEKAAIDAMSSGDDVAGTWSAHDLGTPFISWTSPDFTDCADVNVTGSDIEFDWLADIPHTVGECGIASATRVKLKQLAGTHAVVSL